MHERDTGQTPTPMRSAVRACGACACPRASRVLAQALSRQRGELVICGECGLVRLIDSTDTRTDYQNGSFHRRFELKLDEGEVRDWTPLHRRRIPSSRDRLRSLTANTELRGRRLLEIGTGAGAFLSLATPLCDIAEGVEPNPALARFCREQLGLAVREGWAEDVVPNLAEGAYDVVCMYHVLEHIESPRSLLRSIRRVMATDGVLHVEVPNLIHNFVRAKTDLDRFVCAPHRFYFTFESLRSLLTASGFEVFTAETPRPHWLAMLAHKAKPAHSAHRNGALAVRTYLNAWRAWSSLVHRKARSAERDPRRRSAVIPNR